MSHCSGDSASPFASPRPRPSYERPPPAWSSAGWRFLTASAGARPMASLAAAPSIAALLATVVANAPLSVRTVASPMAVFSSTILPPAALIAAWAASWLAPLSYRTTYSRLPSDAPSAAAATPRTPQASSAASSTLRMGGSSSDVCERPPASPSAACGPRSHARARRPETSAARNLSEEVLVATSDERRGARTGVGGHDPLQPGEDGGRRPGVLAAHEVGRRCRLVGDGDPRRVHLAPVGVGPPAPVLERREAGDA